MVEGTRACTHAVPRTQRHARSATHAAPRTHTQHVRWGRAGRSVSHPPPFPPPSCSVHFQALVCVGWGAGVAGSSGTCLAQAVQHLQAQAMQQGVLLAVQHKGVRAVGAGGRGERVPWRQWRHPLQLQCGSDHHCDILGVGSMLCWNNCRLSV